MLPPPEMFLAGLQLPWDEDWLAAGSDLIRGVIAELPSSTPAVLQANTNLEVHEHPWRRVHLFEALGFELFQEKHGYLWVDRGEPLEVTSRPGLWRRSATMPTGRSFPRSRRGVWIATTTTTTTPTGPENWARVMMTCLRPEDRSSCFIGYEDGEPIGMVGLSAFDEEGTGTISYIGVASRTPWSWLWSETVDGRDSRRPAAGLPARSCRTSTCSTLPCGRRWLPAAISPISGSGTGGPTGCDFGERRPRLEVDARTCDVDV